MAAAHIRASARRVGRTPPPGPYTGPDGFNIQAPEFRPQSSGLRVQALAVGAKQLVDRH